MAVTVVCSVRILTVVAIAVVSATAMHPLLSSEAGFVSQGNSCVCADWPDGIITCDEDSCMYLCSSLVPSLNCQPFSATFFQLNMQKKQVGSGDWVRGYNNVCMVST